MDDTARLSSFSETPSFKSFLTAACNAVSTFFFITLPIIKPGLVAGALFAFIIQARLRDTVQIYGRQAQMLGLTGWPLWRWLILPRLRPQIGFAAGLTGALSMGDLGVIALFADPDSATLPLQMYRLMGAYRMEAAAGAALILLALSLGIFWIFDKGGRWHADA